MLQPPGFNVGKGKDRNADDEKEETVNLSKKAFEDGEDTGEEVSDSNEGPGVEASQKSVMHETVSWESLQEFMKMYEDMGY